MRNPLRINRAAEGARSRARITMLLENNTYPFDVRVKAEAEALVRAGYPVEVIAPRGRGEARRERVNGVEVRRFRAIEGSDHGIAGFLAEFVVATVALHAAAVRSLVRGQCLPPPSQSTGRSVPGGCALPARRAERDLRPPRSRARDDRGKARAGPVHMAREAVRAADVRLRDARARHQRLLRRDRHPPRRQVARRRDGRPQRAAGGVDRDPDQPARRRARAGRAPSYAGTLSTQDGAEGSRRCSPACAGSIRRSSRC